MKNFTVFKSIDDVDRDLMVENVKKFYDYYTKGLSVGLSVEIDDSLVDCESPIEQIMSMKIYNFGLYNISIGNPYIEVSNIKKNENIYFGDKKTNYKADFLITVTNKNSDGDKKVLKIIIECDGYDFHQKTKEQVDNDNIRERRLQSNGFIVFRYSGREIINDNKNIILKSVTDYIWKEHYKFMGVEN